MLIISSLTCLVFNTTRQFMTDWGEAVIYHVEIIGVSNVATVLGKCLSMLSLLLVELAALKTTIYCSRKGLYLILSVSSYSRTLGYWGWEAGSTSSSGLAGGAPGWVLQGRSLPLHITAHARPWQEEAGWVQSSHSPSCPTTSLLLGGGCTASTAPTRHLC